MKFKKLVSALVAATILGASANSALAAGKSYGPDDTLVISLAAALASIDPIKANSPRTEGNVLSHVYSTLARIGPDGELQGDAAEKWEHISPNEWLFTLRPGIKFTNGDPLDAEAVAAAFNRAMDRSQSSVAARISTFESVEVKSPTEVLFKTKSLDFHFPFRTEEVYLSNAAWIEQNNAAVAALGSGPYKIVSYDPQGVIKLERNEDYYGEKPYFRNVELRVVATEAGRIAGVQADEIDVVAGLDPISIPQLRSNDNLVVGAVPGFRAHFLLFDTSKAPLDNADVRRALNYAVNKSEIAETVLQGLVEPSTQFFAKGMPGYDPELKGYDYNPEKARELLANAGYPDGFETEILNAPGSYAGDDLIIQAVAQQLSDVGVKASIKNLPYTTYLEHVFSSSPDKQPSPINFRSFGYRFAANNTTRVQLFGTGFRGNMYNNPEYDAIRDAAFAAQSEEEQEALYRQLNHIIQDQAPLIVLFDEPQTYAYNKGLDWTPRPEGWLRAYDIRPAQP